MHRCLVWAILLDLALILVAGCGSDADVVLPKKPAPLPTEPPQTAEPATMPAAPSP